MSLNTANRSFWRLVAVAFAPYLVVAAVCCGVVSIAAYRLQSDGERLLGGAAVIAMAGAAVIVTTVAVVLAVRSLRRQLAATRGMQAQFRRDRLNPDPKVAQAAQRARIRKVDVVDDDRAYSLTYGLTAPRVVISRGLVERTGMAELEAVLAHERYHVRNLDPFKVLVARILRSALFFLPALRNLHDRYLAGRELAADRAAYRKCGKEPLAAALYKVAASPAPATAGPAAAIGGTDLLDVRLAQLEGGREPPLPVIPWWSVVTTGVGVIAMTIGIALIIGFVAGSGAASSLPGSGAAGLACALGCATLWVVGGVLMWRRAVRRRA